MSLTEEINLKMIEAYNNADHEMGQLSACYNNNMDYKLMEALGQGIEVQQEHLKYCIESLEREYKEVLALGLAENKLTEVMKQDKDRSDTLLEMIEAYNNANHGIRQLQMDYKQDLKELEDNYDKKVRSFKDEYDKETEPLRVGYYKAIKSWNVYYKENNVAHLKEVHEKKMKDLKEVHEKKMKDLKENYDKEMGI